ncbi:hypothetical protein MGU_09091 [Metarhizium guizhouense ARSEF 977]|uniref:Methyltransferase n=1 Tax=Metarhizium guizhouense (strain ARSEF 977) TaxID=1276136 RepID=A0A0B4GV93_METGA|nr:hypothetical protein MGU_09091 [Metarhizium guizhouense ARSEF 977]
MSISAFQEEALIEKIYIPELESHFKEVLAAKQVRALDFQLRLRDRNFPYYGTKPELKPQPSLMTHIDVTPDATKSIVQELYGEAADQIMQSRYQIITVWRPLRVPVKDWPLALCDASTVESKDLVPSDVIYPNYLAENRLVHYNDNQRWYWLSDQAENEVLVFKAVDSDPKQCNRNFGKLKRVKACPHGAFPLPDQGEAQSLRESIDVRLLVMYADMEYPEPESWSGSEIKV